MPHPIEPGADEPDGSVVLQTALSVHHVCNEPRLHPAVAAEVGDLGPDQTAAANAARANSPRRERSGHRTHVVVELGAGAVPALPR